MMTNLREKHQRVAELLMANAQQSNRVIAAATKIHHVTVGKVRAALELGGQINHQEKIRGKDGIEQPSHKYSLATPIRAALADPSRTAADIAREFGVGLRYVMNLSGDRSRRIGMNRHAARKATLSFNKAIDHIFNTCEHMSEVPLPPDLNAELIESAKRRLKESRAMLSRFMTRIEREPYDGNT